MLLADRGYDADWIRAPAVKTRRALGPTSHHGAIAKSRSASACFFTGLAIWSSGSSTRSSIVVECATSLRRTTSHSSSLLLCCTLMSPHHLEGATLPTCKQAVHKEHDNCANNGANQPSALARPVPSQSLA